jgi:hypothetical protein
MKHKKELVVKSRGQIINSKESPSASASPGLSKSEIFILGGAVVAYLFFVKTLNVIINYPMIVGYLVGASVFIIIFVYKVSSFVAKTIRTGSLLRGAGEVFLRVLRSAVCAWFVSGIILIPFNYYNIYVAQNNPAIIVHLPITGVVANAKSHKIYYEFNGKMGLLNGKDDLMNEIYDKGNYMDYSLVVIIHAALFDSYFIEDWYIQKK